MDIYRFFNSCDIADYLQKIGHRFTAYEMAYLIYHSKSTTLEDKCHAWQWVIDNMPDKAIPNNREWLHDEANHNSIHEIITQAIVTTQQSQRAFLDAEGCWYSIDKRWNDETRYIDMVFDSFLGCVEYLRNEIREEDEAIKEAQEEGSIYPFLSKIERRLIITKRKIGGDRIARAILDRDLNIIDISLEYDTDVDEIFSNGHIQLPVPFSLGDIVVDATDSFAKPFVFDCLLFWDSQTMREHGIKLDEPDDRQKKRDARIRKYNDRHVWDCSHMVAIGYELIEDSRLYGASDVLWCDNFGATNNYLDLEYYRGHLEGESRILKVVSEFVKDELDIETALNLTHYIQADAYAKRLRDFIEMQYDDYVKSFLVDEYPWFVNNPNTSQKSGYS